MATPSATTPPRPAALRNPTLGAGIALEKARDALVAALDALQARLRRASQPVRVAATNAAQATAAVAVTAERAAHAPADVAREVRKELHAWAHGMGRMAAWGALLAVFALFALVLLTAALVEGLDGLFGEPVGALVAGAIYLGGAAFALQAFRNAQREAKAEREVHARHVGETMEHVAAPLREAADERRAGQA